MLLASRFPHFLAAAAVLLAAPSAAHAAQVACEPNAAAGTAVLEGTVLDIETSLPLYGAEVTVTWSGADGRTVARKTGTAGGGEFRFCDVPALAFVSVQAKWFDQRSAARELAMQGERSRLVLEVKSPHVVVTGHVVEDGTGAPLAAASVRVGPGAPQLTNEAGRFRFDRVPPGFFDVVVERLGFATVHDSVAVEYGTQVDLNIRLSVQAVPLDPIRVVIRSLVLERTGFYAREARGLGTFITRQDIEARLPQSSSDLLRRIPGIRLVRGRSGDQLALGRGSCAFRFVIDGVRLGQVFSIDEMPPQWIEGLEVYHGPSQVPIEFAAGPGETNANCGVMVIWTRNRR